MANLCESCKQAQPEEADDAHIRCFECGHVYQTAQDLIDADNEVRKRLMEKWPNVGPVPLAESDHEVYSCQCCAHDF